MVLVDLAMLARLSPAVTLWLDTMLQFVLMVVVLFAARTGARRIPAAERMREKCILVRL